MKYRIIRKYSYISKDMKYFAQKKLWWGWKTIQDSYFPVVVQKAVEDDRQILKERLLKTQIIKEYEE